MRCRGCGCGFLYGWGGSGGFGGWGFGVGGELGAGHGLHLVEDGCVQGGIVPFQGEGVGIAIGCVRDGDHLVKVLRETGELGKVRVGHGAGGLAAMKIGPVWVVVQGSGADD
jgi:hypothetical protein